MSAPWPWIDSRADQIVVVVTFIGLNAIRILSIVSLILVFSSTIFVMVNNIKAVNAFEAHKGDVDMENCDYIEYVYILPCLSLNSTDVLFIV